MEVKLDSNAILVSLQEECDRRVLECSGANGNVIRHAEVIFEENE